ncbi:DUF4412 domain-containing protein [Gelidibacter sp. F2691]|nr:DUF4412 domain-containing protein [Gelidibacter sp. F2691]
MKQSLFLRFFLSLSFLCSTVIVFAQGESQELRNAYDFDYIYKLKMTHKKDEIIFDYYLKKDADYFGFDIASMTQGQEGMKMFTIMDNANAITGMFMEVMGKKIVKSSKIKLDDFADEAENSDYSFTKTDSKTILGYHCDGFIGENKDTKVTFYVTNEAPVSFSKMWDNGKTKLPKGFNPAWMAKYSENALMMEMHYVDKKKDKNNMTMECIGVDETNFSLQTSEYGSMFGGFGK